MPCITYLPDTSTSPTISDAVFATLVTKFTEYGYDIIAEAIIGAQADGRSRELISSKLIDVINYGLYSQEYRLLNCILKVPDTFAFDQDEFDDYYMGNDLAFDIWNQGGHWPKDIMVGTEPVAGYKLIHIVFTMNAAAPAKFLWLLFTIYELDFTIMALQTWDGSQTFWPMNSTVLYALIDDTYGYDGLSNYAGAADWVV